MSSLSSSSSPSHTFFDNRFRGNCLSGQVKGHTVNSKLEKTYSIKQRLCNSCRIPYTRLYCHCLDGIPCLLNLKHELVHNCAASAVWQIHTMLSVTQTCCLFGNALTSQYRPVKWDLRSHWCLNLCEGLLYTHVLCAFSSFINFVMFNPELYYFLCYYWLFYLSLLMYHHVFYINAPIVHSTYPSQVSGDNAIFLISWSQFVCSHSDRHKNNLTTKKTESKHMECENNHAEKIWKHTRCKKTQS